MNSVRSNSLSLKYKWFTLSGCKGKRIKKFEFVAKAQILSHYWSKNFPRTNLFYASVTAFLYQCAGRGEGHNDLVASIRRVALVCLWVSRLYPISILCIAFSSTLTFKYLARVQRDIYRKTIIGKKLKLKKDAKFWRLKYHFYFSHL